MSINYYWPQYKVFLFAQLSLFPEHLTNKLLSFSQIDSNGSNSTAKDAVVMLQECASQGLFKLEVIFDISYIEHEKRLMAASLVGGIMPSSSSYTPAKKFGLGRAFEKVKGGKKLDDKDVLFLLENFNNEVRTYMKFRVSDIDSNMATTNLVEYLEKYKNDELSTGRSTKPESYLNQFNKLYIALKQLHSTFKLTPIVALTDIWQDPFSRPSNLTTFWELILTSHFSGHIKVSNIGYDGSYTVSSLLDRKTYTHHPSKPFAEVKILEPIQKMMFPPQPERPKVVSDSKADKLTADSDGRIRLDGKDLELRFQLRQVCRLLIEKYPGIVLLDEFTGHVDIFNPDKMPKNPSQTLQKYISELRGKLSPYFVISNDQKEGYKLVLSSDLKSE